VSDLPSIGWVGTGVMGRSMALHLLEALHHLGLFRVQLQRLRFHVLDGLERIAGNDGVGYLDPALRLQRLVQRRGHAVGEVHHSPFAGSAASSLAKACVPATKNARPTAAR